MMTLINTCAFQFSPPRVALDVSSDGMSELLVASHKQKKR
jgi:hypothetical protein